MEEVKMLQPQIIKNFEQIARFIFVPTNVLEYDRIVELLDEITDIVRDDEAHPLANLMDVLGVLIETYENQSIPEPEPDPISVLKHLMNEYNLKQKDLPELGTQGVVSEILNRKPNIKIRSNKK